MRAGPPAETLDPPRNLDLGGMLWSLIRPVLLVGLFLYTFVGTTLLSDASVEGRAEGNIVDRVLIFGLFGLSLFLLAAHWRAAVSCIVRNLGAMAIVALCIVSILWSDFPALTLRRSLLFFFIVVITLAIAASVDDLRRLHTQIFAALSVTILFNLLMVVAAPSIGNSELGVRGLYAQKNLAGIVAMIAAVFGMTWTVAAEGARRKMVGLLALVPILLFLVLTKSKTSINLTALAMVIVLYFAYAERLGAWYILLTIGLGALLIAAGLIGLAAIDFDMEVLLDATIGDRSVTGRDELWAFAWKEVMKAPLLGHGYGAFWDVGIASDPLHRADFGSWLSTVTKGVINQAHNGYLELALHIGMPAVALATLSVMKAAGLGAFRAVLGDGGTQERAAIGAFALLLVLHLVHNLSEATLMMRGANFCTTALFAQFMIARWRDLKFASGAPARR